MNPGDERAAAQGEQDAAGPEGVLLRSPDRVLATLDSDGKRRWIRPRPSSGKWYTRRRNLAWFLMAVFVLIPIVHVDGKPLVLLDLPRREFTLFTLSFVPTDTALLMLILLGCGVGIFLSTALFGRWWCGWACPQTVYMEFLFRPLDRIFEGSYAQQQRLDREGGGWRRWAKNAVFAVVACFLAHSFLAYFAGWKQLLTWIQGSPTQHPTAFAVMGGVTAAMVFNFTWFREQTCLVACPYGRLQAALFDRQSLIVGYDENRGEPRGKPGRKRKGTSLPVAEPEAQRGDCIECGACVATCPTGIDIRDGLQMECITCTQCIDACDAIMDRVGKPRGLIRYCSQAELAEEPKRTLLRPRVIIYSAILLVLGTTLLVSWVQRGAMRVDVLRGLDTPFVELPTGEISNQLRLKVRNLQSQERDYRLEGVDLKGGELIAPQPRFSLEGGGMFTSTLFVKLPREGFDARGRCSITVRVTDDAGNSEDVVYTLLGPRP